MLVMGPKTMMAVDFMKVNLHRRLLLTELADVVKLSVTHLGYLFRTETGMSPGQYLMMLRMEKAKELLEDQSLRVKEVMAKVGFSDKSDFTRSFKKAYGVSPSRYRAANSDSDSAG